MENEFWVNSCLNQRIIDNFINKLHEIKEENLVIDKNYYSSLFSEEEMKKLIFVLSLNENNKLYFIQKGGLEHVFQRIKNFSSFLELM